MTRRGFSRLGRAAALALVLVTSIGAASRASAGPPDLSTFTRELGEHIVDAMSTHGVPGVVVALVEDGALVWSEAYGYADLGSARPMAVEAVSRTESISKSLTAWGVMKLIEHGAVGLDDPVFEYLGDWSFPESAYPVEEITVRQLLSHTAGLAPGSIGVHFAPDGEVPSLEENLVKEARLVQAPGSSFLYSNVGFNLLELLVEEVTGRDFAEYMDREILAPLGMHDSSFAWNTDLAGELPTGYDLAGRPVPAYVYPEKASGGLHSSVQDIARFVAAGMTDKGGSDRPVLALDSVRQLYRASVTITGMFGFVADSYGLGYFIETLADGKKAVWHGGQGHGWMTHFHSVPEAGDGIVILTNSQRSWPLIAGVLSEWSEWNGFPPLGMSIITPATKAVWAIIALAWSLSIAQLWRVARGVYAGRRRLAPLSTTAPVVRSLQLVVATVLVAILVWAMNQEYLFVSSIFPRPAGWLGSTMLGVAFVLLVSALVPRVEV